MADPSTLGTALPGVHPRGYNLTAILVCTILVAAVIGSLLASALAIHGADPELPPQYHWEGSDFDRDVAFAHRATDLKISASLLTSIERRTCRVQLTLTGAAPAALVLSWVHATDPMLDRVVRLRPERAGYEGSCAGLTVAHYHLEMADEPHTWSLRQEVFDPRQPLQLVARP